MAKSSTRKRFAKKEKVYVPPEVSREIDVTARRIKNWTNRELNNLQQQQNPVCIPIENGYRIGSYRLRCYPNKTCEVWDDGKYLIHSFGDKVSAVLYTIYTIKQNVNLALEILRLDTIINKNYRDIITLRRCFDAANKRKEYATADIRAARIDLAERRMKAAQAELERIHRVAKVNKVWL